MAREDMCNNQNHSKLNVSVRFCSACGKIVNKYIQIRHCSEEVHRNKRKERNQFCVDCGKNLQA